MSSMTPMNPPLGFVAPTKSLLDFVFPDEKGKHEQSLISEDSMAQIRAIARSSNLKKTPSTASVTSSLQLAPPSPFGSSTSSAQILPQSQQQLSSLLSVTSQSTTSSTYSSSNQSLGSTGSQGTGILG